MQKESVLILSIFLIAILAFSVHAQESSETVDSPETTDDVSVEQEPIQEDSTTDETQTEESTDLLEEVSEEYSDASLEVEAGSTPGQFGYFIDEFLDSFGNEADVMAEKFAEIKKLLNEGKKDEARVALKNFRDYANKVQENASPEERDKLRKYVAAINNELSFLRGQGHDDFVSEIESSARNVLSAMELVKVIEGACKNLASLAVSDFEAQKQFENLCKPSESSSRWHKEYYESLTDEQKEEVKKFIKVIKSCFKNPRECDCAAATDNQDFVNQCSLIAKAEANCQDGDESACQASEDIGEGIFETLSDSPHLQGALEEIEREFSNIEDERFDSHMPSECREAGITGRENDARKQCMLITLRSDSEEGPPEECREALIEAVENGETSDRELRKICEEAMFKENAPQECIDAEITDHKECGRFMFKENAPQECLDAGLTGESPRDHRKCEEIMKKFDGGERRGHGPGINFDCRKIEDPEKRLDCFDKIASQVRDNFDNRGEGRWPYQCEEARATTPESCEKVMREWSQTRNEEERRFDNGGRGPNDFRQGLPCNTPEECERFRQENPDFRPFQQQEFNDFQEGGLSTEQDFGSSDNNNFENSGSASSFEENQDTIPGTSSSEGSSGTSSSGTITGNIIRGNPFLRYYFR